VILCPSVPTIRDQTIMASTPACKAERSPEAAAASTPPSFVVPQQASASKSTALPRSHAHAVSVKNVFVDADEAPQAAAETSFRVRCTPGEGIAVDRMVRRSRLNRQAQAWRSPTALGAPAAAGVAMQAAGQPGGEKPPLVANPNAYIFGITMFGILSACANITGFFNGPV